MLELFTRHGAFDLDLSCTGDLDVDQHHTVEDVGIALGEAFDHALGDKRGILRAGYFLMPMDETLAIAAVDLSGRPHSPSTPKSARASSAICKPSSSTISSKASPAARAPTSTSKPCTAAPITTRSRPSSKPSHAPCASPVRATSNWVKCCQAPKVCSDARTVIDYKAGNLTSVLKALRHLGADPVVTERPRPRASRADRIVLPGVGHFAANRTPR